MQPAQEFRVYRAVVTAQLQFMRRLTAVLFRHDDKIGDTPPLLPPITAYYRAIFSSPGEIEEVQNIRTATVLSAAAVLFGAAWISACAAMPKQGTPKLQGVANFRDIGGYKTADGHTLRHGLLYRSAQLSKMTPADQKALSGLGVRYVFDLRNDQERREQASNWGADAPKVMTPFRYPEDGRVTSNTVGVASMTNKFLAPSTTVEEINEMLKQMYATMIIERAGEIGGILHELSAEESPALIHCTGGKDRTGQTVAVLMTALGVPSEQVYAEYLKSNDSVAAWYEDMKAKAQAAGQPFDLTFEMFQARSGASRTWLEQSFASIDSHYGSFENYTRDGLKLTPSDLARLKTKYLQN
jgi:protein-tyrosine phosphatase